eukprot:186581-Alexandrium_andersonii.AAC.1
MSVAELRAAVAQQPVAALSESSGDPPVVPLNLPVDGAVPPGGARRPAQPGPAWAHRPHQRSCRQC